MFVKSECQENNLSYYFAWIIKLYNNFQFLYFLYYTGKKVVHTAHHCCWQPSVLPSICHRCFMPWCQTDMNFLSSLPLFLSNFPHCHDILQCLHVVTCPMSPSHHVPNVSFLMTCPIFPLSWHAQCLPSHDVPNIPLVMMCPLSPLSWHAQCPPSHHVPNEYGFSPVLSSQFFLWVNFCQDIITFCIYPWCCHYSFIKPHLGSFHTISHYSAHDSFRYIRNGLNTTFKNSLISIDILHKKILFVKCVFC